jgi:hypothetical protein
MTITQSHWPSLGGFLLLGLTTMAANAAGPTAPAPTAAAASAAATAAGENCEVLRGQIESRIAAAGVAGFSVRTVDASAAVETGRVVGTCGRGSRKIVYETQAAPSSAAMTTECRDGSTPVGGVCKP